MTEARLQAVLDRQMPDAEKRRRADFVVQTGLDKAHSLNQLRRIVTVLRAGAEAAGRPRPLREIIGRYG